MSEIHSPLRRKLRRSSLLAMAIAGVALPTFSAHAANVTWTGGGNNPGWTTAENWTPGLPAGSDALFFGGDTGLNNFNFFAPNTPFSGLTFTADAASFTLNGNAINLTGNVTSNSLQVQTINLPLDLQQNTTFHVSTPQGQIVVSGPVSGGFGITKTGGGLLTLNTATNTFTGPVTVLAGALQVDNDARLGAVPVAPTPASIRLDGGALRLNTNLTVINSNRGITLGNAGANTGGSLDVNAGVTAFYNGVIADNGGTNNLIKTGAGILVLGGANTYSGNTIVNHGTLRVDFNQAGAPTSNIITAGSRLILGGVPTVVGGVNQGTNGAQTAFNVSGSSTGAVSQTVNGVTLRPGSNAINTTQTSSQNVLLNLGAITREAGGAVNFARGGTFVANTNAITTTNTNDASGILGGWAAFNGTDYAAVDGTGNIVAYTGYVNIGTAGATVIADNPNGNYKITGNTATTLAGSAGSVTNVNTILQGQNAGIPTINIAAGQTLRFGANGGLLISAGNRGMVVGNVIGQGTITAGGAPNTPGDLNVLIFNAPAQPVVDFRSVIADNGTGAVRLVINEYAGATGNDVRLNVANTYSGGTIIASGRVTNQSVTGFGTGPVTILQQGQAYVGGLGTYSNDFNIVGASNSFSDTPSALRFNGGNATVSQVIAGRVTLLGDAQISTRNAIYNVISGQITDGANSFNLTFDGAGTNNSGLVNGTTSNLILSNTLNNWHGNTNIQGIKLDLGNSNVIPNGAGFGNLVLSNSTSTIFDLDGMNETVNGVISNGANATIINSAFGTTSVLTLGDNNATATFGGTLRNSIDESGILAVTKIGSGVQTFSGTGNTYSGPTNIDAGALSIISSLNTTGTVNVNASPASAGELRGTGTVGNVVMAPNNGANKARLNPGVTTFGTGALGTLTMSSLVVNGGELDVDLAATAGISDLLSVAGSISFNGASTIVLYGSAGTGTYTIASAGGPISYGVLPTLVNNIPGRGSNISLDTTTDPTKILVNVISNSLSLTWTAGTNGNWDNNLTTNWKNGATPEKFIVGDSVVFDDSSASGTVTLADAVTPGVITVNSTKDYLFTGPGAITGSGSLVKSGSGKLTMTTPNSYVGDTVINAGILQLEQGAQFASANVINNGSLVVNNAATPITISGPITGTGTLTKQNTGSLTLTSTANTYSGGTTLDGGWLFVNTGSAGGSTGTLTLNGGVLAALNTTPGVLKVLDNPTFVPPGATVTLTGANGSDLQLNGPLSGSGTIKNAGINDINFQSSVRFSGDISAFTGTFDFSNSTGNGNNFIFDANAMNASNAKFFVHDAGTSKRIIINPPGGTFQMGELSGNGSIQGAGGAAAISTTFMIGALNTSTTFSGSILNDGPTSLVKVGTGNLTLTGVNTLAGTTSVQGGTLTLANSSALQASLINSMSGIVLSSTVTNRTFGFGGFTFSDNFNMVNQAGETIALLLGGGNNTSAYTGVLSGGGSLTKVGTGTLILTNTHVYTGTTTIAAGVLQLGNGNTTGSLPAGPIVNNGTLAFNRSDNINYTGAISGTGGIAQFGPGTLTLSGALTNTGALTVANGRLILRSNITTDTASFITVGNTFNQNAVLDVAGATILANKNSNPTVQVGTVGGSSGLINMSAGSFTSANEFHLGRAQGAYAGMNFSGGTVSINSYLVVGNNLDVAIMNMSGGVLNVTNNLPTIAAGNGGNSTGHFNLSGGTVTSTAANGGFLVGESGVAVLNVYGTGTIVAGGTGVTFGRRTGAGLQGDGTLNLHTGGRITANRVVKGTGDTGPNFATFNFHGGTLQASANNATNFIAGLDRAIVYSGGAVIDDGGFTVHAPQTLTAPTGNGVSATGLNLGSITGLTVPPLVKVLDNTGQGTGATAVATISPTGNLTGIIVTNPGQGYTDPSQVFFELTTAPGITWIVSGTPTLVANATTGGLTKQGTGTLILTGANTYGGATTIAAGTLQIGNGGTAGQLGVGPVTSNGVLAFNRSDSLTINHAITGTGGVGHSGAGTTTLTGSVALSGTSPLSGTGLLVMAGANPALGRVTGTGRLAVAAGTTLTSNGVVAASLQVDGTHVVRANGSALGAGKVSTLAIAGTTNAWTGKLDLTNNALVVQAADAGAKAALLTTLQNQIASGRAGGTWTGTGITSSTIPTTPSTSLALADNAHLNLTTIRDIALDANSIIIVQARNGDATLNGAVDAFDLNILAANWQGIGKIWSTGDFTGDGIVDAFDLNILAANWQFGTGGSLESALAAFPVFGGGAAAVPEPASLAVLALGGAALLARRRRGA